MGKSKAGNPSTMRSFWSNIKHAYHIVPSRYRAKLRISLLFTYLNGLLDIISLAALIPVILVFISPDSINDNTWLMHTFETVGFGGQPSSQVILLLVVVLLFISKNLISIYVNHYISTSVFDIATSISERALRKFYQQSYLDYTQANSAVLTRQIKTIPHDFANYVLIPQLNILTEISIGGFIISAILLYEPFICILLIVAMAPLLLSWKWFKRKHISKIENDFKDRYPLSLKYLLQGLDGYVDIKLYGKQDFFIQRFVREKQSMNRNYAYLKTASFVPSKVLELSLVLSIALIFGYSTVVGNATHLIPTLSLFIAGFYRLYPSITRIINGVTTLNAYGYVIEELRDLEMPLTSGSQENIRFSNELCIQNLNFSYPQKTGLLKNLNLVIKKGSCIGLSGVSGSGKTTLIKILAGFIKPDVADILIDGESSNIYNNDHWFEKIAYLQQQPIVIDGTLEENIAFGENHANHARLTQAIVDAGLEDFMYTLPDGLHTLLGENGTLISGGQRQRIALARALYREAEIFIFDEISNNLDDDNINKILASLVKLKALSKTIIIADHDRRLIDLADTLWNVSHGHVQIIHETLVEV